MEVNYLAAISVNRGNLSSSSAVHDVSRELDGRDEIAAGSTVDPVDVFCWVVVLRQDLTEQSRLDPLP